MSRRNIFIVVLIVLIVHLSVLVSIYKLSRPSIIDWARYHGIPIGASQNYLISRVGKPDIRVSCNLLHSLLDSRLAKDEEWIDYTEYMSMHQEMRPMDIKYNDAIVFDLSKSRKSKLMKSSDHVRAYRPDWLDSIEYRDAEIWIYESNHTVRGTTYAYFYIIKNDLVVEQSRSSHWKITGFRGVRCNK